mmetsp:Transcript_22147/g.66475  ORF Transcript_22147/g.66475 Transcript_22147/m.66475 type:complete len:90 (+) Transcript_22147:207-476(+)
MFEQASHMQSTACAPTATLRRAPAVTPLAHPAPGAESATDDDRLSRTKALTEFMSTQKTSPASAWYGCIAAPLPCKTLDLRCYWRSPLL